MAVPLGTKFPYKPRPRKPLAERIREFSIPEPNSGCWLWIGTTAGRGYGCIGISARRGKDRSASFYAHRISYETFVGPIPDGMVVMHKCDVPACVNPNHLRLGTHLDNVNDCVAKKRHAGVQKTCCPKGHPYTWTDKNGRRRCRICITAASKRWLHRKKAGLIP